MSEKRNIYKITTIGVLVLCAVLLIALAYSVMTYTSLLQGKDAEILYWQNQASSASSDINSLQAQVDQLESDKSSLQNQLDQKDSEIQNLTKIIKLAESTIWINDETVENLASYARWTFDASYAGYVVVHVKTSTTRHTYVQVLYTSHDLNYDETVSFDYHGMATFPILPGSIEVRVGTTDIMVITTQQVMAIYYY